MITKEQKEICKQVLEKFPELGEYISNSNWDAFWKKLVIIDDEIFNEGIRYVTPTRLTNGREVRFSTLFFMILSEAGISFKMEKLPFGYFMNNSQIEEVVLPSGMDTIGAYAFAHSSVHRVIIPDTVISIKEYAFKDCRFLEEVVIPESVKVFGTTIFEDSYVRKVKLPKKLKMSTVPQVFGVKDPSVIEYY